MSPNEKGWLRRYIAFRRRHLIDKEFPLSPYMDMESGEFLYKLIQPTGLIYGHPLLWEDIQHPRQNEWDENARVKVLMTESFLQCGIYLYHPPKNSEDEIDRLFQKVVSDVKTFYQQSFNQNPTSSYGKFFPQRSDLSVIETLLDQRIALPRRLSNFWTGFFHNSLIYLDLIFFLRWAELEGSDFDFGLHRERELVRINLLKLIAATANADKQVSPEEKILFNFFLESADLPANKMKAARAFLSQGIGLGDIDLRFINHWVLKKYFLEIALLTIRADRDIKSEEMDYLEKLVVKLEMDPAEIGHSMIAIENFIAEHKPRVHYLQTKQLYRLASERYANSLQLAVRKNRRRITQEIAESKELMYLLGKSRREELSPEEWEKVRKQLLDILKAIPTFTIFMLPGGSITLPLLLKILPKKMLYPSSFLED